LTLREGMYKVKNRIEGEKIENTTFMMPSKARTCKIDMMDKLNFIFAQYSIVEHCFRQDN
jgi:hypothetical protein